MSEGEVFCDKALTQNVPRSVTILAKTDYICIILEIKDFQNVLDFFNVSKKQRQ